jgi:hypothetical protein
VTITIQLVGPMTGLPNFNYDTFNAYAQILRDRGFVVHNPAENFDGDQTRDYPEYIQAALNTLLYSDAIFLLPGWEGSTGAALEHHVATVTRKVIYRRLEDLPEIPRRPLVCMVGKKYSGKSTLADALRSAYWIPRESFANPLKRGLRLLGCEVDGPNKDVEALQFIGTDFFRARDENWWVKTFARLPTVEAALQRGGLAIDDCRFPNELSWCHDQGFLLVKLLISRETQHRRADELGVPLEQRKFDHASETALDDIEDSAYHLILPEDTTVQERLERVHRELELRGFDCSNYRGGEFSDLEVGEDAFGGEASPSQIEPVYI